MYVSITGVENNKDVYINQSYRKENGKTSSRIYWKLGKLNELLRQFDGDFESMMVWAKSEAEKDTAEYNARTSGVSVSLSRTAYIPKNEERCFQAGYLFLQKLCAQLKIDSICKKISKRHKYTYDLGAILTGLVYSRILSPSSRLSSFSYCKTLLEPPKYELHNVYRALSVMAGESDFIQEELYKTRTLFIPETKKCSTTTVQTTTSRLNKRMNSGAMGRARSTALIPSLQWGCLWMRMASLFLLTSAPEVYETIYYKEVPVINGNIDETVIVTYSPKYKAYQKRIRDQQISRAIKMIEQPGKKRKGKNQNDPARFIKTTNVTNDGEIAEKKVCELDLDRIRDEEKYDGFYAVITNLEGDIDGILKINRQRWEIEENFRIMKTDFEARPVYVRREDRIKAHFLTCYISLLVYRLPEKRIGNNYTCNEILSTLRSMQVTLLSKEIGYIPSYKRTVLTDDLHKAFGFHTDYEFISKSAMRSIIKSTKTEEVKK